MDERIVELIVSIVDKLVEGREDSETIDLLTHSLLAEGYSIAEINNAFMWLYHTVDENYFLEGKLKCGGPSTSTVRVLNDFERSMITPQAYGYILRLSQLGLLDVLQIEEVIERAIYSCSDMVELNDVKRIVPSIIMEGIPGFRPGLISWRSGEMDGSVPH